MRFHRSSLSKLWEFSLKNALVAYQTRAQKLIRSFSIIQLKMCLEVTTNANAFATLTSKVDMSIEPCDPGLTYPDSSFIQIMGSSCVGLAHTPTTNSGLSSGRPKTYNRKLNMNNLLLFRAHNKRKEDPKVNYYSNTLAISQVTNILKN